MATKNATIPEVQEATQGKYYQVDFRAVRPLDIAGGNVREEYESIPELADSILAGGIIGDKKFTELVGDTKREDWPRVFGGENKKFAGQFLKGGINTALVGYSKTTEDGKLYFTLAGHRRTKACEMIFKEYGIITMVPFVPKDIRSMSELDIISFMLDENENRVGLSIFEQARTAKRMQDLGASLGEIASRFKRKRDYFFVKNLLKLEAAPKEVKEMIQSGVIAHSNVVTLMEVVKDDTELIARMRELHTQAQQTGNGKPVKIKAKDVKKNLGTINSSIEVHRFFKKYKDAPAFASPEAEIKWNTLKEVSENRLTLADLEKQLLPTT